MNRIALVFPALVVALSGCELITGVEVPPPCEPATCATLQATCGTLSDGCGGTLNCGSCRLPASCGGGGTPNVCGCKPEEDEDFCVRLGLDCGSVTEGDNCGVNRTTECGSCKAPKTCGGSGTPNVCGVGCIAETNVAFCQRLGKQCGSVTAPDNCGTPRSLECGSCTAPESCGGGGTPNVCGQGCVGETDVAFCQRLGKHCGSVAATDNCSQPRTADCGTCTAPATCGGGGTANVCGTTCAAETDAAFCARLGKDCGQVSGTDNCAKARTAECGTCTAPATCGGRGVANVCGLACTPESDPTFCARLGKDCGAVSDADNCGKARTASCGTCTAPATCGGGGVANVCGSTCTSETDAAFCARLGKNCGSFSATDNCGKARTASCGACTAPATCGGGGVANVCGPTCTSETDVVFCTRLGKNCGSFSGTDNCGKARTAACGACTSPGTCTANVCSCPDTSGDICVRLGKNCGQLEAIDKCGARRMVDCGTCTGPKTCGGGGTENVCGCTETKAAFCARLSKSCGSVTAKDACGVTQTYHCGTCGAGQRCVSNACVCDATSCPNGCCEGPVCKPGDVAGACGKGGRACSACWPGQTCTAKECTGCTSPQDTCSSESECCDPAGSMCREDGYDAVCCRAAGQACRTSGDCCNNASCVNGVCGCAAAGDDCLVARDCCDAAGSSCRTPDGEYYDACCRNAGASCTSSDDCCNGASCSAGKCSCATPGSSCLIAADCCDPAGSSCRTPQGEYYEACCRNAGATCTSSDDCCNGGNCTAGRCSCAAPRQSCQVVSDCCDAAGSSCRSEGAGYSACCRRAGSSCTSSNDCCNNGVCSGGLCSCAMPGGSCGSDTDCCDSANSTCKYTSGVWRCCRDTGATCAANADCCSGTCNASGKCT